MRRADRVEARVSVDVVNLFARRVEGEAFEVGRDGEAAARGDAREGVVALLVRFRHGGESARERHGDAGQCVPLRVNNRSVDDVIDERAREVNSGLVALQVVHRAARRREAEAGLRGRDGEAAVLREAGELVVA